MQLNRKNAHGQRSAERIDSLAVYIQRHYAERLGVEGAAEFASKLPEADAMLRKKQRMAANRASKRKKKKNT